MRKLFLIVSMVFVATILPAKDVITLKVRVEAYKGSVDGTRIELYCNSKVETSLKVNKLGKCDVRLSFNNDYRLAIVKEGYVTKYIDVNTDVPASILDYDSDFPPEKLNVTLFPFKENVDISVFKQPVEKLFYDNTLDDMVFDKEYAKLRKKRIEIAEELLRAINRRKVQILETNIASKEAAVESNVLVEDKIVQPKKKLVVNKPVKKVVEKKEVDKIKAVAVVGMIGGMRVVADATSRGGAELPFELQEKQIRKALELMGKIEIQKAAPVVTTEKVSKTKLPDNLKEVKDKLVKIDTLSSIALDDVIKQVSETKEIVGSYLDSIPGTEINDPQKDVVEESIEKPEAKRVIIKTRYELLSEKDRLKLDNDYNILITKGDTAFNIGNYAIARFFYLQAKQLKLFEKYPVEKLEDINSILMDAKYQKLKKKFREIVNKADGYFKKNSYVVARFYYERARDILSWDEHVKKRLNEIEAKIGK